LYSDLIRFKNKNYLNSPDISIKKRTAKLVKEYVHQQLISADRNESLWKTMGKMSEDERKEYINSFRDELKELEKLLIKKVSDKK